MATFQNFTSTWGAADYDYKTTYPNTGSSDTPWGYGQSSQSSYPGAPYSGETSRMSPGQDAYWGKGRQTFFRGNLQSTRGSRDPYGHFTFKVPPYWEPSDEKRYPYHVWVRDLDLWCAQTEVAVAQRGPSIASRHAR